MVFRWSSTWDSVIRVASGMAPWQEPPREAQRVEASVEQPLRSLGPEGSSQKRLDAASDMACALRRDLVGSICRCVFIERSPAAFPVRRAANGWVNRLIALKDFSGCRRARVIDSGCDEG